MPAKPPNCVGQGKQIKTSTRLPIGKVRSSDGKGVVLFITSPILLTGLFPQVVIAEMRFLTKFSLPNLFRRFLCLKVAFNTNDTKRRQLTER